MLISIDEINKSLSKFGWDYFDSKINKQFKFDTYMDGINFINCIANIAERKNHHPDINIGWCEVNISISSHDMGGVTTNCVNLAMEIDSEFLKNKG
tara:strand:+ start:122 stop:409 length:288 start_codon:yes stop_codon:yes gene_type:complete